MPAATRSPAEPTDLRVSRVLAFILSLASALFTIKPGGSTGLTDSVAAACVSMLILGTIGLRVGARRAYAGPLSVATCVLLLPALAVTLLVALHLVLKS